MARRCRFCNAPMPRDSMLITCVECKQPNFPGALAEVGKPETVILSKVSEGKTRVRRPRIPVGIFGDPVGELGEEGFQPGIYGFDAETGTWGLADTSVVIVGGRQGSGKTTKFLMMCDYVLDFYTAPTDEVLYIANEMADEELEDFAKRLQIRNWDRIRVHNTMGGMRLGFPDLIGKYKPRMAILDSFTNFLRIEGLLDDQGAEVVGALKNLSVQYKMPWLLVMQVNKELEIKGQNNVMHQCDTILHMDSDDVTGKRILYSSKNRFGQAPVERWLRMQEFGEDRPGMLVLWDR